MSDSALSVLVILFLILIWNIRVLVQASLESQERIEQIKADAAVKCACAMSPYLDEPEDEPEDEDPTDQTDPPAPSTSSDRTASGA